MSRTEDAVSQFEKGYNCAQAILSTYGVELGIDLESALRLSCGFGGGMARMAETCGAVTGAFMVLGLKFPSSKGGDFDAKEKTYEAVHRFAEKFNAKNGSIVCRDLLGCDIGTEEGRSLAVDNQLFYTKCPGFVRFAAEIIEEML
ncbi:MAG: C_GCAxxG_C_C family protein [Deltaproteobacteria bacterium]|uniref:C_GCAxxG_C_C family protein n=1 Tax=Candidatus Zymogenus saltonus TaxID=2844893 RepID=A0A9D8KH58_9DELT|nr:C_GCAxxG_C_C family protein [Candidatus Zymogenus saltonus]